MATLKKIVWFLIFIMLVHRFFPEEKGKGKYFVLENKLKVYVRQRSTIPLVNIVIAVNLGTKDETHKNRGLVHILEHLILFRGSGEHTGDEIGRRIREHGAYFNGHTAHDLSTFEIALPAEHLDFALSILREILFNLKLSQDELEKEKKVILEEIKQSKDNPVKAATNLVFQAIFKGHPYEHPVYGDPEVIKTAETESIKMFYERYFSPGNCTLAVVGDIDVVACKEKIIKTFGSIPSQKITQSSFPKVTGLKKSVYIEKKMDVKKAHMMFGFIAPAIDQKNKMAMRLLTQILGKGFNPFLGRITYGRRKQAEMVSMSYFPMRYGGVALIYLKLDPGKVSAAKNYIMRLIRDAASLDYSPDDVLPAKRHGVFDYLETARNQMLMNSESFKETGLNAASAYARYMLMSIPENKNYINRLDSMDSSSIRKAVSGHLNGKKYVMVTVIPGSGEEISNEN